MADRVLIGDTDMTEQVAAMYDAIVGSMDWGSGFLDSDTVRAILLVGRACGFDIPKADAPYTHRPATPLNGSTDDWRAYAEKLRIANEKWNQQLTAELDAKLAEMRGEV